MFKRYFMYLLNIKVTYVCYILVYIIISIYIQ